MGTPVTNSDPRREAKVLDAFVRLSNELVEEYDVIDMLTTLTVSCAELLDVASAGLLLADDQGVLHLVASSSERTRHLEVFQLQRVQGPCLDCFYSGEAVWAAGLTEMERRWPEFARAAEVVGFGSVHALPMRLRDHALGAIGLFNEGAVRLVEADVVLAQALVHVACVGVLNARNLRDRGVVNQQLEHALSSRVVLEQAKGVIASSGGLEMEAAFAVLRHYARSHGRRLSEVAAEVVDRRLRADTLIDHARR